MRATNPGPILDIVDPLTEVIRESEELLEARPKSNLSKFERRMEVVVCSTPEKG